MTTMRDLDELRELAGKLDDQQTFRLRFVDDVERLRGGGQVADGVVLPDQPTCYVAERRMKSTSAGAMVWTVVYAHSNQMPVAHWVLAELGGEG